MIHKETYGFNTFAATRVGEIQGGTEKNDWYWTESKNNIADWLTRGKRPIDIDINSNGRQDLTFSDCLKTNGRSLKHLQQYKGYRKLSKHLSIL